jgi:hypothetical protein
MNRLAGGIFVCLFAILGGLYGWARLRSEIGGVDVPGPVFVEGPAKHVVTRDMAEASRQMIVMPSST